VQEPVVGISPADAAKRNIFTGNKIRLFNKTGEIISTAIVSNRIQSGIIILPNGIWNSEGGGGNHLIVGSETDIGFGAAFHDNMVQVERID
jgi:anaerobic selenocysteine-containing dehydrogenase